MKKVLVIVFTLMFIVSMVGCSQPGPSDTDATSGSEQTNSTSGETDGTPKSGGTVKMAISSEPTTLLSWATRNATDVGILVLTNEYLFRFDEAGTPQPYLVESYVGDPETMTYTFKLKSGIQFHDGSPMDAEAVAWNLNKYKTDGVLSGSFYGFVESIEAVDDMTVVVKMSQWDSLFPVALARTCPITSKTAYDEYGEEYLASHPVGTGPFKFSNWEHDVKVSLVKFDDYWQGTPYLDGLECIIYGETLVAAAALEAGEIDVFIPTDYDIAANLTTKKDITVETVALTGRGYTLCYMCNNPEDPLNDIRVRQAISYAIDTKAIAEATTQGYYFESNQWCPKESPYYSQEVTGHPYDIEKAKDLLAEAGYPNGFDTRITGETGMLEDGGQIIAEQLAQIGINVELNFVERANYGGYIGGWEYGMILHPMGTSNGQASQLAANFKQGLESGLGVNAFVISDELNDLVLDAVAAPFGEADNLYRDIAYKVFEEDLLCKVIVLTKNVIAYSSDLQFDGTWLKNNYYNSWHSTWLDR